MNNIKFVEVLKGAVAGNHEDLEKILKLYEPMIHRYLFRCHAYFNRGFLNYAENRL